MLVKKSSKNSIKSSDPKQISTNLEEANQIAIESNNDKNHF